MLARPLHASPIPANSSADTVALSGCRRLGHSPMPVQRQVWYLLEAKRPNGRPLYPQVVVEVPRRAGKTDGIMALLVGRCLAYPGYRVGFAAQSGVKSRARFLDLITLLGRSGGGGWTAYRSRGEERVNFTNGSVISFHPPDPEHFRGDAFDCIVLDETQEVDEEEAADLLGSLLPVFDTRPESQLIVAGTAGAARSGLLWEALEQGRAGRWGILEYALPEGADPEDESIWLQVHPGPAGVSLPRTPWRCCGSGTLRWTRRCSGGSTWASGRRGRPRWSSPRVCGPPWRSTARLSSPSASAWPTSAHPTAPGLL